MLMDMPHQNPNSILEQWQCELAHELIRIIIPINLMIDLKLLVLQLSHKLKPSGHSSLWNNHITNINLVLLVLRAMSSSLTVVNLAHRLSLYCFFVVWFKKQQARAQLGTVLLQFFNAETCNWQDGRPEKSLC